jgi:D-alanyl-D-alanine carboxypeptidase
MRKLLLLIICLLLLQSEVLASQEGISSLVIDVNRLKVLHQKNAQVKKYPASLTKMMTLYLTFDALKNKKITLNSKISVSKIASCQKPSKLNLRPGETITVREAIQALIVKSANDVAYALAEKLSGDSMDKFILMMNNKAKKLGMSHTSFANPHGWHDPKQYTNAYDMAKLAIALRKYHPEYFKLFSSKSFTFKGQKIKTHNKVLLSCQQVDGIKTGFTNAAGFNLVTSVKNKKANIVAVILGSDSSQARDKKMLNLIQPYLI